MAGTGVVDRGACGRRAWRAHGTIAVALALAAGAVCAAPARPRIAGDAGNNQFVVRLAADDASRLEARVDGRLVLAIPTATLRGLVLEGGPGDDTFVVD